jgi:hypothetical protein
MRSPSHAGNLEQHVEVAAHHGRPARAQEFPSKPCCASRQRHAMQAGGVNLTAGERKCGKRAASHMLNADNVMLPLSGKGACHHRLHLYLNRCHNRTTQHNAPHTHHCRHTQPKACGNHHHCYSLQLPVTSMLRHSRCSCSASARAAAAIDFNEATSRM